MSEDRALEMVARALCAAAPENNRSEAKWLDYAWDARAAIEAYQRHLTTIDARDPPISEVAYRLRLIPSGICHQAAQRVEALEIEIRRLRQKIEEDDATVAAVMQQIGGMFGAAAADVEPPNEATAAAQGDYSAAMAITPLPEKAKASQRNTLIPAARVRKMLGISDMTLWRWLQDPDVGFPRPIYIQKRRYWRTADLNDWIEAKASNAAARTEEGPKG